MKKIFYWTAIAVILLQVVTACSKEEKFYTCDPETDAWVKNNLTEIQLMHRQDLQPFSDEQQRGCFRAFTPEQRYKVWIDKLIHVGNLNLSRDKVQHIDVLIAKMKVNWYDEKAREDTTFSAEIDNFIQQWIADAYKLGWTRNEIGGIVATLREVEIKDNTIVLKNSPDLDSTEDGDKGIIYDCECSLRSDWCWWSTCKNKICDKTGWCGTLFLYECNGMCVQGVSDNVTVQPQPRN